MDDTESELEEYVTSDHYFKSIGEYKGERNESYERHGQGIATYGKGDKYAGQFSNGRRNGEGIYKFKNARYDGSYKDGERDGTGTMIYPDGSKYIGRWKEGMKHGRGIYHYANGDTFEGEWQEDLKHGGGVYCYQDTGSLFYAIWESGHQKGIAKLVHTNHHYEGVFKDNKPCGTGQYTFEDGCIQHGFYARKNQIIKRLDGSMTSVKSEPEWQAKLLTHILIKKEFVNVADE